MQPILKPGKNCWCLEPAERISYLVDGQAIFEAFEAAARQANKSLLIVGWDIDSRVRLRRSTSPGGDAGSPTLGAFLENLAESREGLKIHILIWDFPVIYASDREPLPIFNLDWKTHQLVKGPVAGKLGDLARERWYRATGQRLPKPTGAKIHDWPLSVPADLENAPVAIARTRGTTTGISASTARSSMMPIRPRRSGCGCIPRS